MIGKIHTWEKEQGGHGQEEATKDLGWSISSNITLLTTHPLDEVWKAEGKLLRYVLEEEEINRNPDLTPLNLSAILDNIQHLTLPTADAFQMYIGWMALHRVPDLGKSTPETAELHPFGLALGYFQVSLSQDVLKIHHQPTWGRSHQEELCSQVAESSLFPISLWSHVSRRKLKYQSWAVSIFRVHQQDLTSWEDFGKVAVNMAIGQISPASFLPYDLPDLSLWLLKCHLVFPLWSNPHCLIYFSKIYF